MGVLLISQGKLKAFCDINVNLDVELLLPNIQYAQDLMQATIGTALYNHLLDAVRTSTLTPDEIILLEDYIQPVLLHKAYHEAIPSLWVRVMNSGIQQSNAEGGTSIDAGSMKYLRNIQENRYQFYNQRLLDWLNAKSNLYPLYNTYNSTDGGMPASDQNYFSGVVIPDGNRGSVYPVGRRSQSGDYDGCWDC